MYDTNPFRYCGEYWDKETGEIYLRARYYNPGTGRFSTVDPAMDGTNWYVYCKGNPIMFLDRTGMAPRPYQPELWNDTPDNPNDVQYRTNCYAYALDFCGVISYGNRAGEVLPIGKPQPGQWRPTDYQTLLHLIYNANSREGNIGAQALAGAMLDALGNGHTFRLATSENILGDNLGENEWVVYLVAESNGGDYHWYRQNPDGTWSHKPGGSPVTNREYLGVAYYGDEKYDYIYGDIITDPTDISRHSYIYFYDNDGNLIEQEEGKNYDIVVGAYVVGY